MKFKRRATTAKKRRATTAKKTSTVKRKVTDKAVCSRGPNKTHTRTGKGTHTLTGECSVAKIRGDLQWPRKKFARLTDISERTLADLEKRPEKRLTDSQRRTMTEIRRLFDALAEIMLPGFIGQWLNSSNAEFGGAKPIEVVERGETDRIYELIYRLRSGQPT